MLRFQVHCITCQKEDTPTNTHSSFTNSAVASSSSHFIISTQMQSLSESVTLPSAAYPAIPHRLQPHNQRITTPSSSPFKPPKRPASMSSESSAAEKRPSAIHESWSTDSGRLFDLRVIVRSPARRWKCGVLRMVAVTRRWVVRRRRWSEPRQSSGRRYSYDGNVVLKTSIWY